MEATASPPLWERRESRSRAPARHFCGPFADGVASQPFAAYAAPTGECSAALSRAANAEGTISPSFPPKRESSKTTSFMGSRFRGKDGKVFLNSCLLDVRWKRPPALPCGSDACREGALQRDHFAGHSRKGSLRNPSRLTPLPQGRAMQRPPSNQRASPGAAG
jgi:hypothetical protein